MFPLNPWRRWNLKKLVPTQRDSAIALVIYQIGFASCFFLFGLFCVFMLALLVWAAVAKDRADERALWVLGGVALFVILCQWWTWRFIRNRWGVLCTYRIARLGNPAP